MASKKYRNKTCVYCGKDRASSTGDHVIAREFFPLSARANLPQVPACEKCNREKSYLEHYVLAVLPIGGRHADVGTAISEQVAPRLAKNAALVRQLAAGQRPFFVLNESRTWEAWSATPFELDKLKKLACNIAHGLAWHHWQIQLAPHAHAKCAQMTAQGVQRYREDISGPAIGRRADGCFGDGVFTYSGAYQRTNPMRTVWEMSFFGGVEIGPMSMSGESTRTVFVATDNGKEWRARRPEEGGDSEAAASKRPLRPEATILSG